MCRVRNHAALTTALAAAALGGCGEAKPANGTWSVSTDLERRIERRLERRAELRRTLPARLAMQRERGRAVARRASALRAAARRQRSLSAQQSAVRVCTPPPHRSQPPPPPVEDRTSGESLPGADGIVGALMESVVGIFQPFADFLASIGDFSLVGPSTSMSCSSPYATVAASHGRAGLRLDEQATRLEASAEALARASTHTRQRILAEIDLRRRIHAKAAAVSGLHVTSVTCTTSDDAMLVRLDMHNTGRTPITALVAPRPGGIDPDASSIEAVDLAAGQRRHVELRASEHGGARSGRCAPALQDVRLQG